MTLLMYGTREPSDVCYYPRSGKVYFIRGVGLVAPRRASARLLGRRGLMAGAWATVVRVEGVSRRGGKVTRSWRLSRLLPRLQPRPEPRSGRNPSEPIAVDEPPRLQAVPAPAPSALSLPQPETAR